MQKKLLGVLLIAVCALGLLAGTASAKDEVLLQDMIALEKVYIPALFFTNQPDKLLPAKKALQMYRGAWNQFKATYADYRPDYANWGVYFEDIEYALQDAEAVVASVTPENPETLVLAHEALEGVRATMLILRPLNGFPKFITDKMTQFHDPMEQIVIALKTQPMSPELIAEVEATFVVTMKAWDEVEKCPVDAGLWGFSVEKMLAYYAKIAEEAAALDNLTAALESGDPVAIKMAGTLAIKEPFVQAYTMFGDFTPFAQ